MTACSASPLHLTLQDIITQSMWNCVNDHAKRTRHKQVNDLFTTGDAQPTENQTCHVMQIMHPNHKTCTPTPYFLSSLEQGEKVIYTNSACIVQRMKRYDNVNSSTSRTSDTPEQPLHAASVHDDAPAGNKTHEPQNGQDQDREEEELGVV